MKIVTGENKPGGWTGAAIFSKCESYRYSLSRTWNNAGDAKVINFIMLNPSTADTMKNDPTVERCCKRAQALGYDRLIVTNIFALRSTDPEALYAAVDAVGQKNDKYLKEAAQKAAVVVCAWGNHGAHQRRGDAVVKLLSRTVKGNVFRLGKPTQVNQPRHPLYVSYQEELIVRDVEWI